MKRERQNVRIEEVVSTELNRNTAEALFLKGIKNSIENPRFFIYAKKSCPRRSLDALKLQKYLVDNHWQPVSNPRKADFIFVYTCGSFVQYERTSIFTIDKALKNESAKVIVTGCLPKINPVLLEKYATAYVTSPDAPEMIAPVKAGFSYSELQDISIRNGIHDLYRGKLADRITVKKLLSFAYYSAKRFFYSLQRRKTAEEVLFTYNTYRIEIGKGCVGDCSYCAIRIGMPEYKSRSEDEVIEEFKSGLKKGYKTFALISGDIGCYGLDIGTDLPSLLSKIFAVSGDYKVILWDLNARWFLRYQSELIAVLKDNFEKVERIIMPIQSGSNRILKRMSRHYRIEEVKSCILKLKNDAPGIILETQILVGFPGETDEDFRESLDLVREMDFYDVAIFQYEDRPGTRAANMDAKVSKDVIKRRNKILRKEISRKKKSACPRS